MEDKGKGRGRGRGKGKGKGKGRGKGKAKAKAKAQATKPSPKKPSPKAKASSSKRTKKAPEEISEERSKDQETASKRRKSKESKGDDKAVADGVADADSNLTWARRRRPKSEFGALKWDTLKAVFNEDIRPSLTYPSIHEDHFCPKKGHLCFTNQII